MTDHEAVAALDKAISTFVTASGNPGALLTGWVLSGSLKHPALHQSDGYFIQHSPGLPYHSQLGLLMAGLEEKKNLVLINTYKEENQ
jgi:hypothetical protein